jgi:protein ImuB
LEQLILQFPAGYGSQRLEIQLYGEGEETELVLETYSPSSCRLHWQKLLRLRMESLRLTRPVEKVQLRATALAPMEARQMELFSGAPRERPEELADLLDRLSSRLGRQAVLRPRPVADVQPEYACRYTPVIAEGKEKASRTKTSPAPTKPDSKEDLYRHRPLRLCSEPIALPVVSIVPEGPPLRFQWEDHEYQVVQAWGPERIETGWWRGGRIARDYYRLETQTGLRLWIFRRRRDGQWFLQGWFD